MKKLILIGALAIALFSGNAHAQVVTPVSVMPVVASSAAPLGWMFPTAVGLSEIVVILIATQVDPWTPLFPAVVYSYPRQKSHA